MAVGHNDALLLPTKKKNVAISCEWAFYLFVWKKNDLSSLTAIKNHGQKSKR
jgi:hypothetical protein